jgi:protein-S-isoprenylcysteine O-methyltransferase Ste14
MVAGVIPWLITRWETGDSLPDWLPLRAAGAALVAAGGIVIVNAFARFVREGIGTPAPAAPTQHLVVGGLYRYVRNPMYLAVDGAIVGQALLLCRAELLVWAAFVTTANAAFVHLYEEPTLRRQFGESYDAYRAEVPAWLPRRISHR